MKYLGTSVAVPATMLIPCVSWAKFTSWSLSSLECDLRKLRAYDFLRYFSSRTEGLYGLFPATTKEIFKN